MVAGGDDHGWHHRSHHLGGHSRRVTFPTLPPPFLHSSTPRTGCVPRQWLQRWRWQQHGARRCCDAVACEEGPVLHAHARRREEWYQDTLRMHVSSSDAVTRKEVGVSKDAGVHHARTLQRQGVASAGRCVGRASHSGIGSVRRCRDPVASRDPDRCICIAILTLP